MQMCPNCDRVYDESEYSKCPYCSGELEEEHGERYFKYCPRCGDGIMYWENGYWYCTNCDEEIESEDWNDYDGTIEY